MALSKHWWRRVRSEEERGIKIKTMDTPFECLSFIFNVIIDRVRFKSILLLLFCFF